jgi:hypothetical protein
MSGTLMKIQLGKWYFYSVQLELTPDFHIVPVMGLEFVVG